MDQSDQHTRQLHELRAATVGYNFSRAIFEERFTFKDYTSYQINRGIAIIVVPILFWSCMVFFFGLWLLVTAIPSVPISVMLAYFFVTFLDSDKHYSNSQKEFLHDYIAYRLYYRRRHVVNGRKYRPRRSQAVLATSPIRQLGRKESNVA